MAQFKRVWLKYKTEVDFKNSAGMTTVEVYPTDNENTQKADDEIQDLIKEGWKIVSTAPVNKSSNILNPAGNDVYATYTSGIEVFMVKE